MHPRSLYLAELLLYVVGGLLVVRALLGGYSFLFAACGLAMVACGFGLSGEVRATWVLALAACIVAVREPVLAVLRQPSALWESAAVLDAVMVAVVAAALLQPEVRGYRLRWLR